MPQNIDILVSFGQEVPRSTHVFLTLKAIEVEVSSREREINDDVTYAVIILA